MKKHLLSAKNLQLGYEQKVIVENMQLNVPDGKISVIIGANGSGKSTLLNVLIFLNHLLL